MTEESNTRKPCDEDIIATLVKLPAAQIADIRLGLAQLSITPDMPKALSRTFLALARVGEEDDVVLKAFRRLNPMELEIFTEGMSKALLQPGTAWDVEFRAAIRALAHHVAVENLEAVNAAAPAIRARRPIGGRSTSILAFIDQHPDGVSAAEVEARFGPNSRANLSRMANSGRIHRTARGRYIAAPSL